MLDDLFKLLTSTGPLNVSIYGEIGQDVVLILAILSLVSSIQWMRLNRGNIGYEIGLLTLEIHFIVYYLTVFLVRERILDLFPEPNIIFTNWSVALRVHTWLIIFTQIRFRIALSKRRLRDVL